MLCMEESEGKIKRKVARENNITIQGFSGSTFGWGEIF